MKIPEDTIILERIVTNLILDRKLSNRLSGTQYLDYFSAIVPLDARKGNSTRAKYLSDELKIEEAHYETFDVTDKKSIIELHERGLPFEIYSTMYFPVIDRKGWAGDIHLTFTEYSEYNPLEKRTKVTDKTFILGKQTIPAIIAYFELSKGECKDYVAVQDIVRRTGNWMSHGDLMSKSMFEVKRFIEEGRFGPDCDYSKGISYAKIKDYDSIQVTGSHLISTLRE